MSSKTSSFSEAIGWVYDLILSVLALYVNIFFREVDVRGLWKVPRDGAIILVAAPHANQFVDSVILMHIMRGIGRRISWLIAAKSFNLAFIGTTAKAIGAVPVIRADDLAKPGHGTVYLPDPKKNSSILRGIGTNFDAPEYKSGGAIVLPPINGKSHRLDIAEVRSKTELSLKKPAIHEDVQKQLIRTTSTSGAEQGSVFKFLPHVDQTKVYNAVFDRLKSGGSIGIFPEGGSHDRPELLPLKAGVAIMALGSLAKNPDSKVKIVPIGMNYFQAHKFRSRAVVEIGNSIEMSPELVEKYRNDKKREAIDELLDTIYESLIAVTVTSPDYDTLMLVHAARRLYTPRDQKLPLTAVIEINRRLVKGYTRHKDDPKIQRLAKSIKKYNDQLRFFGIRDRQVGYAKFSIVKVLLTLIFRVGLLMFLSIGTLPGVILFAPVFIATRVISERKSKSALAASSVKVRGSDVMATWKLLVALAITPLLNTLYTVILVYWTHRNRVYGYVPDYVPTWTMFIIGFVLFPSISFAALRTGEIGMDILKSLRPLVLCLNPYSASTMSKLTRRREELSRRVIEVINTLGPDMFPNFNSTRIVPPWHEMRYDSSVGTPVLSASSDDDESPISRSRHKISLDEPLNDLSSIEIFSTYPSSRGVIERGEYDSNTDMVRGDTNSKIRQSLDRETYQDGKSLVEGKKDI